MVVSLELALVLVRGVDLNEDFEKQFREDTAVVAGRGLLVVFFEYVFRKFSFFMRYVSLMTLAMN